MKILDKLILTIAMAFLTTLSFAQNKYTLILNTGKQIPVANLEAFIQQPNIRNNEIINGKYYRMVQFFEMPTVADHQRIVATGIELLEYFPHLTYLTAIPANMATSQLEDLNIRAVFPFDNSLKIEPQLLSSILPEWALDRDGVKVILKYHKHIAAADAVKKMEAAGLRIVKSNGINNFMETRIQPEKIERVAALPFVAHLGLGAAPDVKDDIEGRSLHRSNVLDSGIPMGRNYDGTGVNVLVRDDGQIGPHIDFQGRLTQDLADPGTDIDTHGDNVAGIMNGAGNFDPTKRGMAAGTGVYVLDYDATFLDNTMNYFFNDDVIITNSSYSNGCNDGYTEITATVDQQIYDNPTLMHIFSAGNSNNTDCDYGAGDQWGNITGGHKQGKNVMAVANLTDVGTLVNSSSRGPVHDGRIKPDIASNGRDQYGTEPNNTYAEFGGTSGAAPGVAGIFAQLQHAYKTLNGGTTAPAALLKGILLNTANDLGNEGPDFRFGWGHINAFRAVKVLEENRYQQFEVAQGAVNEFTINIPNSVKKAKVMLYWDDPEAAMGTGFALLNDLDLKLQKNGVDYLPWILNASPNQTTLDQPATKGEDHLNNMEQVEIDDPVAGEYTVIVNGTVVPFGSKNFYMIYEYQTAVVNITYPIGRETMVPGELQNIHWDAVGQLEDYELSYSLDGGTTWEAIASVAGTERVYANWTVPNVTTANGKIRVLSSNGSETINEIDFNIAPMIENFAIGTVCPEGIALAWDLMDGADSYDIYALGEKYMDLVGNATENNFLYITNNPEAEQYFSIHANFTNGATSRRVNAIYFAGGLMECTQPNDLATISTSIEANTVFLSCDGINDELFTMEISNNGTETQSDFSVSYQLGAQPIVTDQVAVTIAAGESYVHDFSQTINLAEEGVHILKSWVTINNNNYASNDTITQVFNLMIYEGSGVALDYQETFEGMAFPPVDYIIFNSDNELTWESEVVTQRDGTEGRVAYFNNFDYQSAGDENIEDALLTTLIDLSDATNEMLTFDLAYREYQMGGFNGNEDGFRVAVSTDCGNTYEEVLFEAFGEDLATVGANTNRFFPTNPAVWEKKILDISAYYGQSVIFKFENISRYGNNLFLDNINVEFFEFITPVAQFSTSTEAICQGEMITFTNTSEGAENYQWNFGITNNPSSAIAPGPHTVTFFMPGLNVIQLITSNPVGADTFSLEVFVDEFIIANFESEVIDDGLTVAFTNNSNNGTSFAWDFGDGNTSMEENPTHTYANLGDYTVTLTVDSEWCATADRSRTLELTPTSTSDLSDVFSVKLSPNPNSGRFMLRVNANSQETFDWKLTGVDGKAYRTGRINTNTNREIDIMNLATGIFFLELISNDQHLVERVIIRK